MTGSGAREPVIYPKMKVIPVGYSGDVIPIVNQYEMEWMSPDSMKLI